jgi:hypothetical protein
VRALGIFLIWRRNAYHAAALAIPPKKGGKHAEHAHRIEPISLGSSGAAVNEDAGWFEHVGVDTLRCTPAAVLGVLSLIVWTLITITCIKYVTIAMQIDNDGEGGILALMALLGVKRQRRPAIVALGLFGAALIYGDGAITPAISVLSALEGLTIAAPGFGPYLVPMAVAILVALFVTTHPSATV